MPYDQLDIHSINRASGVYRLHLNFDGNKRWITTGTKTSIQSQGCLMSLGHLVSSRLTEELQNALGNLKIELSDHPDLVYGGGTGNIIRECFESARESGNLVYAILARYSNESIPVFQEFVFSGSVNPREVSVAHRRVPPLTRRTETISCEFTPAKSLDTPLGDINWLQSDLQVDVRPFWLCIVDEPGVNGLLKRGRFLPANLTSMVTVGKYRRYQPGVGGYTEVDIGPVTSLTHDLAYGSHPLSTNTDVGDNRDNVGDGTVVNPSSVGEIFPAGNWAVKLKVAIQKVFDSCDIIWDGIFPDNMNFRYAHYDQGSKTYSDDGEMNADLIFLNWNYLFGFNPYDGTPFKGPCTFDADLKARDFLKAIAAQLKARIDIYAYDSEGLPMARFVSFGQTFGAFPDLEQLPESSEDTFVTDKDGVRITRRGFDGAVIAPADARSPIDIEIPFAPYAIGYETAPAFDASRLTPNASLEFQDQWKCGHRGALGQGGEDETNYPLNPDGWFIGSHLFRFDASLDINQFPPSHNYTPGDFDAGNEEFYKTLRWSGYYPLYAIYETDRGDLTEEQRKERQKNFLISYAIAFGRYLRGERRRLAVQFKGCVAPNWNDICNGLTFNFKPIDSDVEYVSVEIERDILEDVITVQFEESSPSLLPITYKIEGDLVGNASIGGQGSTDGGGQNPSAAVTIGGRFQCTWDSVNKKFQNFTWQGATPNYAPAISGVNNSTDILLTFEKQFPNTLLMAQGYFLYANTDGHIFGNAVDVQWGLNAAKNDTTNSNIVRLTWWKNDWQNAANQKHISQTSFQDVVNQANRYPNMLWVIEFRGTL